MIQEARLEPVESGLTPVTPGWFVVNAREAAWMNNDQTQACCIFESDDFVLRGRPDLTEYVKPGAGFVLRVVRPGRPADMYHAESVQEDFLVLMGECVMIVEDQERPLRAWDFVHCPPGTGHTFVGAGDGPCVLLCAGNRDLNDETFWRVYKRSEVALRYGASVERETNSDAEANAPFRDRWRVERPESWSELPWSAASSRASGHEAMSQVPYVRQPADFSRPIRYAYGSDSYRQPGVPLGAIIEHEWSASRVFPGTHRRYWVYVPAQYTASEPASLMVFQDGHMYLDPEGEIRAPVVFDNLIHRGEMPVTIGVFVDPGEPENRNAEYDALSDAYATFLLTEILPSVRDRYVITDDPDRCAIGGGSSGGSCAFTVAWMRADRFRRVLSFLGSFAQLRGGNRYPALIRDEPRKPLRVFLQAATRDLNWDAAEFNWFSANLRLAAALAEGRYDVRLVLGDGGHDPNHGGAILPDALRWLWRGESE